jgi:catechol 2,3-dioxygenase-like lactoylglutathione lyase family enzyme
MAPAIRILAIDHVQLAMPPGGEAAARRFYGDLLGLREVAKPPALSQRGGCWFTGSSRVTVHLGVDDGFVAAAKAHPCFVVPDLEAARRRLAQAGVAMEPDDSGLAVARGYLRDPFGNRIELVDARDAGFSEPDPPRAQQGA